MKTIRLFSFSLFIIAGCKAEPGGGDSPNLVLGKSYVDSINRLERLYANDSVSYEDADCNTNILLKKFKNLVPAMSKADSAALMEYFNAELRKLKQQEAKQD
jgi:hypothetical protein